MLDYQTHTINVDAPDVFLEVRPALTDRGTGYGYYEPAYVGVGLHIIGRVRLEAPPPGPVDIVVSVPPGSGVLLSASRTEAGSESLVVETGFTSDVASPYTSSFYVQGVVQGNDVDDDVSMTIEVFETGTTNPVGYEQRSSNIDVAPSGFLFQNGADINTTTLSLNEGIRIYAWMLYDGEGGTLYNHWQTQEVRGGHTITVDLTNSDPTVGQVIPAVFTGGLSYTNAEFDPLIPGTTVVEIIPPVDHTAPTDLLDYQTHIINVDAPDVWLYESSPTVRISDQNLGRDLQVERRIRLEVAPPAPGIDVTIEVVDPSVALVSTDPTTVGSASITFTGVTSTYTPYIYMQGLTLGQGTELRITAPGYDQWITTVQVVEAGFYISTADFTTTVDASNKTIRIYTASLDTLQKVDENQQIRGGLSFSVDVLSSDPSVGVITISPLVFTGDVDYLSTAFDPLSVGISTISITQPPGFTQPTEKTSIVATVNPE